MTTPPRLFVLWLDAADGTVATHDGVQWPDEWATLHSRHHGYTSTHFTAEAAAHAVYGKQGRIEWVATQAAVEPAGPATVRPGLRERHHAEWMALTDAERVARLGELDQSDEPAAGEAGTEAPKERCDCPPTNAGLELCQACPGRRNEPAGG